MKLTFNSNAMKTFMTYKKTISDHSKSIKNISTGKQINSAKDNPSRISKLANFEKEIRGYQSSRRNIQDTVSMIQSADSVMGSLNDRVTRLKEITISLGNGSIQGDEKDIIQNEVNSILEGMSYDIEHFSFNEINILGNKDVTDNSNPKLISVLTTGNSGEFSEIPSFNLSIENLGIDGMNVKDDIGFNLEKIDNATSQIINARTKLGAISATFEDKIEQSESIEEVVTGAKSKIEDADVALEMLEFSRTLMLTEANIKNMSKTIYLPNDLIDVLGKLYK
ncbi:flagellin domain-containing protein FliC1 [Candidatus Arthromitus sp. SFB-mouse-Japan]|nr:flagellin [Candidatus Arthromitus sp. SFB-mouse]EIA22029.1 Flagellin domain protein [Candidatus Arthromitus sp. SFB-1]EIA25865.1 Flagellin domain protein [Candidatus Arthromitus sp. SFB-3]EIA27971.1 Flagellin domain protein [Candidatus Arthromitus sp. SFB-4]EIA29203.1 flagellin domain protein [Candidatus Arthromitus sp. SFB-co]EIA30999.1 flagellin domain protein [Candidatus Arthromitus sp. SFB-mouse-SU]